MLITVFRRLSLIALLLFPALLSAQQKKQITIEDIWQNKAFTIKSVPGFNVLRNGTDYTRLDDKTEINCYSLEHGKKKSTLFEKPDSVGEIDHYAFSEDEKKLLIFTDAEPIYRRSIRYRVYIYNTADKSLQLLDADKVLHATFNPTGDKVAFVKNNNLYIDDLINGGLIAVTTDGKKNHIINGNCDWVYEEEFEFTRAFQWSPDGRHIAYYRFDESTVKDYTLYFYETASNYPRSYTYKYPKAGEDNSVVQIKLYDTRSMVTQVADIGKETDQYIPRIKWMGRGENLCIYRLNRHQNKLELLQTSAATGHSRVIYTEENKYYLEINDNLTFLPDGESFILNSEKDGYNHLYLWNWEKQKETRLTSGNWDVDKLVGVDEESRTIFYTAGVESPMERKLYRVGWDGAHQTCITPASGVHNITACKGFHYFLDNYSALNRVPVAALIDETGKTVRVLEDNAALKKAMEQFEFGALSLLKIPNEAGDLLNAWMIKPPHFDPAQKYPVLLYQYSGPGSQEVMDKFPLGQYFWHQLLAGKGYIVVCADGRGTGGRGASFKKQTYLQLGKMESEDQIAVGKFMSAQPYVDKSRVGIWGWSFGGFISATCILKGADVFRTAVAVAPVTNWRFYDNIYTERYMRRPSENEKGYDDNAPERMADKLKGNFLFIHGLADDNVHFQNSAMLADQLIRANKQFETAYYPNKNHSIYGGSTREQLFQKITDYLLKNL
jgi:dipeptidyl-peptidase-4